MSTIDMKPIEQRMTSLIADTQEVVDTAVIGRRELTPAEIAANDRRFSRLDGLRNLREQAEKLKTYAAVRTDNPPAPPNPAPASAPAFHAEPEPLAFHPGERSTYAREVNRYIQTGESGKMIRQFTIIAGPGGVPMPKELAAPSQPDSGNVFREAHTLYGVTPIERMSTTAVVVPVLDADAGGVVAQDAVSENENDPRADETISLTPALYESGTVWVSNTLVAAAGFNFVGAMMPQLAYIKERGFESAIAAAIVADARITQIVNAASTSGITYANLVALNQSLPDRYNAQKVIILSSAAHAAAEGLVDTAGQPLAKRDPQRRGLEINGTPIFRSDKLEAFGASKVVGIVFSLFGFRILDAGAPRLPRYDVPTRPDQTGLNIFANHAAGWAPSAVAKLKTPAS